MKKVIGIIVASIVLVSCNATKKASKTASEDVKLNIYSFKEDVLPIFTASCSPCHTNPEGKHVYLEDHMVAIENIDDILTRVQLPTTDEKFMPFKSKKAPLTEEQIKIIRDWKLSGMQE
ncbi:MAG: hypothetical protein H6553_13860 [Chitinophagales bacterium]|nr:hypothetical protein [Chitinophagales bacterium]